ncbi:MAG: hypothetical protein LQ352_007197 [Teloschistes flavicans]|nr:MAG: hypothetical protein LQ352_007197 [Teloschistes flavicans]
MACKQYFTCHPRIIFIVFGDNIAGPEWLDAQGQAIFQGNPGGFNSLLDIFLKRLSQAFAEATKGDTYVCAPEYNAPSNDFNQELAWGAWEYPVLTSNCDVKRVVRVDPDTSVIRKIWKQGDPPTPNAPKG